MSEKILINQYIPESQYMTMKEILAEHKEYGLYHELVISWVQFGLLKMYVDENGIKRYEPPTNIKNFYTFKDQKSSKRRNEIRKINEERKAKGEPTNEDLFTEEEKNYIPYQVLRMKYDIKMMTIDRWIKKNKIKYVVDNRGYYRFEPPDNNPHYHEMLRNRSRLGFSEDVAIIEEINNNWELKNKLESYNQVSAVSTPLTKNNNALHPFMPDISNLTDTQLDDKITNLIKKYNYVQDENIRHQISMMLDSFKEEQDRRKDEYWKKISSGTGLDGKSYDLNKLVNVQKPQ